MYSLVSGIYSSYFSPQQVNLLVVGVQGSGKTTLLERIKVTNISIDNNNTNNNSARPTAETLRSRIFTNSDPEQYEAPVRRRQSMQHATTSHPSTLPPTSRFGWICPPPPHRLLALSSTTKTRMDSSANFEDIDLDNIDNTEINDDDRSLVSESSLIQKKHTPTAPKLRKAIHNNNTQHPLYRRQGSLEVSATTDTTSRYHNGPAGLPAPRRVSTVDDSVRPDQDDDDEMMEFDLKPGAKMLPSRLIRPTIGMNLAKLHIVGAHSLQVHVWDLGGKLTNLWERYYHDADAVVFVFKNHCNDERLETQLSTLQSVRGSLPDDVPFMILGNIHQNNFPYHCESDVLYSTESVLPKQFQTNPNQALFLVNALSGQGVKTCMEWLLSTAQQAQKQRSNL